MSIDSRPPTVVTPQVVFGALIVIIGIALTADNLGLADAGRIVSAWPLGVVAVGVTMYLRALDTPARVWAGFVMFAGLWLTAGRVFGLPVRLSMLWPIGLVALGVMIIRRARGVPSDRPGMQDQAISDFVFWSGAERRVTSQMFRRADVTAVMGGVELDLRQAAINGEAVIDVFVVMGGLVLRLPPDWTVSNQVVAIMGGATDRSTGTPDTKHRLILRGFVVMGGVEVKT